VAAEYLLGVPIATGVTPGRPVIVRSVDLRKVTEMNAWLIALAMFSMSASGENDGAAPNVAGMLREFAAAYSDVAPERAAIVVQLTIAPPGKTWQVVVDDTGRADLQEGPSEAAVMTLEMSESTLRTIYNGGMTAFTAGAKGSGADTAPLEMEIHPRAESLQSPKDTLLDFIQHFFVRERPERIVLREESSRVVHGAHAIPLYYASGFRSAWYVVKGGQRLNETGDTNPYPQAFVVISGNGRAKIGDVEVEVRGGESYYIPPNSDHVLWPAPGESLELIWFAWGEGA
jgi:mannose-6-phosphate isomerase-like protein (cupin superfamily)